MVLFFSFLASFLSPIRFLVTLLLLGIYNKKIMILPAAIISAVISETVLDATQLTRVWGQGLPYGFAASLLHAIISYYLVRWLKGKNSSGVS